MENNLCDSNLHAEMASYPIPNINKLMIVKRQRSLSVNLDCCRRCEDRSCYVRLLRPRHYFTMVARN